ncbi:MAG TPA: flavin reductase family protein [Dehalococcoidia bacterium]|nr:flavin reductase family protein [Dehalococcoidia bacterium]
MKIDPFDYRAVIGHFATGVTVITTAAGDELQGMTANAVASLSLDPVMLLVCVEKGTYTHRVIEQGRVFAVNVLGDHQEDISRLFAQHAEPELGSLRGVPFRRGVTGAPVLEDCVAFLECRVASIHSGGDHSMVIGEVVEQGIVRDGAPLLFFRGRYRTLAPPAE